jgi:hypothetical protein
MIFALVVIDAIDNPSLSGLQTNKDALYLFPEVVPYFKCGYLIAVTQAVI